MSNVRLTQEIMEVLITVTPNAYPVNPPVEPPPVTPPGGGTNPPGEIGGSGCDEIKLIY